MERGTRKDKGLNLTTGIGGKNIAPFMLTPLGLILASCGGGGSSSGSSGVHVSQDPPSSSNSYSSSTVTANLCLEPLCHARIPRQPQCYVPETVDTEGWLHAEVLGQMDMRAYVTLTGRVKEWVSRGGKNHFPAEIKKCLL